MTTTWAIVAAVVGVVAAAALGAAGYVAIANTTDGEVVGGGEPEVTFPTTPTASLAVLDDSGHLASLAVLAARPGDGDRPGRGGTIVPIPISADSSGGFGDERLPLSETVALFGPDPLTDEVPNLLGVDIDDLAVVDEDQLAQLLAPFGPITVDLPTPVRDSSGRQLAAAGPQTLDPDDVAAVLSATDPTITGAQRYPIDVVVWRALADAVGDGVGTPAPADVFARVTGGSVSVRPLRSSPIVSLDRNPRGVDAAALDRAEMLVIFGHIAPGNVAAPNPGYNFRLVSRFGDDQLPGEATRLDVAYTATKALLDAGANVISVDTSERAAQPKTVIEVSDETLVPAARTLEDVFGPVEVRVGDTRIAGVDVVAELGTDYLARLDATRGDGDNDSCDDGADRMSVDAPVDPDSLNVALTASRRADEKQGRNIIILDVRGVLGITDYFVVVDAPNRRLVRTLVDDVEAGVRETTGRSPLRIEGEREQQWVLMDYGDVVVHVFLDEVRRFYEIERLYRDVPMVSWSA